ncbi:Vacuolar cation/proton exchanger 3 [Monoraphidium neglectum]|uniref:Vacuolar cation/proton exchanger 3 n=1 Tax=Monoraphidium neglectum TaxID=145388 RepID=A0A0D2MWJ3_9CHLO|nr:Vacuolar cation/proton exchanger 3 [Monoraphidium neglectum]KIZ06925.1 Vacuolar cation/proton exchanger 3 [Monoraphidium neglectum]|eukprot:XP_013905944.1 Vacuolar cation/proton exchanger 3 [Monoraphidium neglectum]
MNVLLLPLPFALASHAAGWPAGATFVLALLPLCSLAERLGMITEQLALYTNDSVGGLLNATFGNATEVIIAAFAISKGYLRIVKLTLLGSIVSNLLLVLGSAFIAGGVLHPMQHFNAKGVNVNCGLLILAVISVALPTLLSETTNNRADSHAELVLSRFESILMLVGYATFLLFQLVTHKFLYEGDLTAGDPPPKPTPSQTTSRNPSRAASAPGPLGQLGDEGEDEEEGVRRAGTCHSCGGDGTRRPRSALPAEQRLQQKQQQQLQQARHVNVLASDLELMPLHTAAVDVNSGPAQASGSRRAAAPPQLSNGVGSGSSSGRADLRIAVAAAEAAELGWDEGERTALMPGGAPAVDAAIEEEDADELVLSLPGALLWLAVITVFISVLSDAIMSCINAASTQLKMPMPFLTTIVVPIVGNAAEHASALIFAVKNRMEVALGVAVGSSTQVAVLIIPFCVVLAWAMGQPLDLNFNEFEALVLFISVLLAVVVLQDGSANYLKGLMLVITFLFISAAAAAASGEGGILKTIVSLVLHLDKHLSALIQAHGTATYALLWGIVFCETGLVLTPFLPGDSLLFAAGAFAGMGQLDVGLLFAVFMTSAVLGDAVNYAIGARLGKWALSKQLLNPHHIAQTSKFYAKYGGKTVVLARFVPIVRTFAPFVAGIGSMEYPK